MYPWPPFGIRDVGSNRGAGGSIRSVGGAGVRPQRRAAGGAVMAWAGVSAAGGAVMAWAGVSAAGAGGGAGAGLAATSAADAVGSEGDRPVLLGEGGGDGAVASRRFGTATGGSGV
jgi:hypothetical protein